jgi:hypothetical protein
MYRQLSGGAEKLLGFKISDEVTSEDVRQIGAIVAEKIAVSTKIRLLVDIEGFRHMEPEDLFENLKFARDHAGDIERMAVLSDRVWIKSWLKLGALQTNTEVEHFDRSEIEAAWEWLAH